MEYRMMVKVNCGKEAQFVLRMGLFGALIFGWVSSAQPKRASVSDDLQTIDQLVRELKVQEAHRVVEQKLNSDRNSVDLLVRSSRLWLLLGDVEKDRDLQLRNYEAARAMAQRAITADGRSMIAYLRRAAANGKVALFKGVLQSRELVLQTRQDCQKALELNNASDYERALAHYILGRVHAKLAETPKALRMPLSLQWGSSKEAGDNFAKAVELFPGAIAFRVDYGHWLKSQGQQAQAKAQAQAALALPVADPGDPVKLVEARKLILE